MIKSYVQYGCGLSAPTQWTNFDASPTLRLQKIPLLSKVFAKTLKPVFPSIVKYGDIVKGLPVPNNYCDGVYCSHTLEHLALEDFRISLTNTYNMLKPGGIFRCIVPDLETLTTKYYLKEKEKGNKLASIEFIQSILMGVHKRPTGLKGVISNYFGHAHHLWMWDKESLMEELRSVGFSNIRPCEYGDCKDEMFQYVESKGRFTEAVAIECTK